MTSSMIFVFADDPNLIANAARHDRQRQPRQHQIQPWEIPEPFWNQLSPETRNGWSNEDRDLRSAIFFSKRPSIPAIKNKDLPTLQRSAQVSDLQYDDDSDDGYETACDDTTLIACAVDSNGNNLYFDVDDQLDPDAVITARAASTKPAAKARS